MHTVRVSGRVNIAVQDINPWAKKTVLMIHGWPLSQKIFEYQVNVLPKLGYRVVTMDLRGFGDSDATADGYSYNQMARDIKAVVDALDLRDVTLAGFSMGGAIVTRYMTMFAGHRVKKLALLGAAAPSFTKTPENPYGMTREAVDELIAQAYRDRAQMATDFGKKLFAMPHSDAIKDWFLDISYSASGIGTIETAKSLRDENLFDDLHRIKVPTGIFHGQKDQICPFGLAKIMHANIRGAQLFPFENSGHAVFYDELDRFNETFVTFLENNR